MVNLKVILLCMLFTSVTADDYADEMAQLQKQLEELEKKKKEEVKKDQEKKEKSALDKQWEEYKEVERRKNHHDPLYQKLWDEWTKSDDSVVDKLKETGSDTAAEAGYDFENTVDMVEREENEIVYIVKDLPDRYMYQWKKLRVVQWSLNAYLFGAPFSFFCFFVWTWNIYFNVNLNKWWAHGNLFLLANTFYLTYQSIASIPLVFEWEFVLKHTKVWRLFNIMSAALYNIVFFASAIDLLFGLYVEDKNDFEDEGYITVFLYMFIAYNLIYHIPVVPINFLIIAKEVQLHWFTLLANKRRPKHADKLELSLIDMEDLVKFILHLADPTYLIRMWFKFTFGWDPKDTVIENKNDEEHYLMNVSK